MILIASLRIRIKYLILTGYAHADLRWCRYNPKQNPQPVSLNITYFVQQDIYLTMIFYTYLCTLHLYTLIILD